MKVSWKLGVLGICVAIVTAAFLSGCERPVTQPVPETVPAAPTVVAGSIFPLRDERGQRCLVDFTGRPFMLHGDTAWSLLVQLKREDAERYLEDRHRRGFNTLLVNLIEHKYAVKAPRNAYGEPPFIEQENFARPNEKYFAHVDWVLTRATQLGFLVLLTPSYLGYEGGDQGWYSDMRDSGAATLHAYGRYLGMRYRNFKNIVWMDGGDFAPPQRDLFQAIVDGVRETNPEALHSFHAARGISARAYLGNGAQWLGLNTIYTDENGVVAAALAEYAASSLPFFLVEARYEGEGATEAVVRAQAYQAMLSGACGQLLGNKPVWGFDAGWERALDSQGARSMTQMRPLMEKFQWRQMRPAPDGFIGEGAGTGGDHVAAAISMDGRRIVVYIPSSRNIAIDAAKLAGSKTTAQWIDPANAKSEPPKALQTGSDSRMRLSPPGQNSSGYNDWLLVLESTT